MLILGRMKNTRFSKILKRLAEQSPEKKLRIAFNLWQFVDDLRTQGKNYAKRKANATRTTA